MTEELIIRKIDKEKEKYIEFFRKLVQCDSINPPGNEMNVALVVEAFLKEVGIKTELFPFGNNRANLVAYLTNTFNGKNLLFNGHMDTVPPGTENDWKYPPLSATIKRNKLIFGRGTTDMKGGLAAMVITLKILKELDVHIDGNLILNAVADEEIGGELGTGWSVENPLKDIKCNFAIIGEASALSPLPKAILVGEKGHLQIKITTNGISGHSGMPSISKNAIYMMSEIIEKLDKLDELIPPPKPPMSLEKVKSLIGVVFPSKEIFQRIMKEQPELEGVMLSITSYSKALTMIRGGVKENVIPDSCEGVLDVRLLPNQKSEPIVEALKKLIEEDIGYEVRDKTSTSSTKIFVELEVISDSEGSYWDEWEDSEDLKLLYSIVEDIYEKKPFYFLLPGSADARYLRNKGYCPQTILFGPGEGRSAHAVDEHVEIQDFLRAIKVYSIFAYRFLSKN